MNKIKVCTFALMTANPLPIPRNLIDVENVIAAKNPTLLKLIPRFIIRYLKHILHQDQINDYIYRNRDKHGLDFVAVILQEFGVTVKITAPAISPLQGADVASLDPRCIIAANHPLGGLDGLALMQAIGEIFPDVVFPVNDILMNIPGLKPLFIPINKHGTNAENIRIIDRTFASDKTILYFPAGLVSRKQRDGGIRDLEWKKTFITKARKYHRDIIPATIAGQNSNFFYNLANWRKRLGISANIEMLYLVDEMMRQKDQTIHITLGQPIPWISLDGSKTDAEWANHVKSLVYRAND